jgi:hypothetical protein
VKSPLKTSPTRADAEPWGIVAPVSWPNGCFPPIAVVRLRRHRCIFTKRRLRPRRALFDETGTVLSRLAVELDETLAPLGWVLGVGSRTAAGEVSPDDASPAAHLDAPLLAVLRPAAPLLVSRQIVAQLLSQVEKSRPTLVWATRALVGGQRAGSAMVAELLEVAACETCRLS